MIYIVSVMSFLFGYCLCALLTFDTEPESYERLYIKGRNEGYKKGYYDCYKRLMGDSTAWCREEEK